MKAKNDESRCSFGAKNTFENSILYVHRIGIPTVPYWCSLRCMISTCLYVYIQLSQRLEAGGCTVDTGTSGSESRS